MFALLTGGKYGVVKSRSGPLFTLHLIKLIVAIFLLSRTVRNVIGRQVTRNGDGWENRIY